jgi:hypothetical protein
MANLMRDDPVGTISTLFQQLKTWRTPYENRWKSFYKQYRSYRDPTAYPFKSNIFVPYTFSMIESVVPKMLGTIFNTRPIISVIPRQVESENMAKLLERLLEYQLDDENLELFNKVLEFFKETAIYGTAFAKIIPKFNDDEITSFNYIDIEPIDIFNVYPDYRAKSVRRMKYIIQLSYMDYEELEDLEDQGFYTNVPDLLGMLESVNHVDEWKRQRLSSVGILDEYGYDPTRKIVEVLEYWDKDWVYVVGARSILLKKEPNPFGGLIPFIMARYVPVQHELYGIGIPEICSSLQEELNTVRNQRMDNVNLIINRMFIANKYADIDFDNLVSYPGNVILSNDVDAIKPLDTRDITKSAYQEEEIIKKDIQDSVGEYEYSRGALPQRRETATGIVRLQQASNIRFDTIVKMLEFTVLRNVAKVFLWLDYQFLDPMDFAKIVGPEAFETYGGMAFYDQDIDSMLKGFNFQPVGSSTTAVKDVRIQQMMQLYQMFNKDPMINQMELRKMVMDALDVKNVGQLLQPPPPPQPPPTPPGQPSPGMEGVPQPPAPPQPGAQMSSGPATPDQAQIQELMKIIGGGLLNKGQAPMVTPPGMPGPNPLSQQQ